MTTFKETLLILQKGLCDGSITVEAPHDFDARTRVCKLCSITKLMAIQLGVYRCEGAEVKTIAKV